MQNFSPHNRNARVSNATRSHYLPHQQVRRAIPGLSNRSFKGNFYDNYFGVSSKMFGDNGSRNIFTNLLKTNFLNKTLYTDQNQLANTNTHNQNLILSDQSSHSTPAVAAKSRTESSRAGLSVAALNINLSSLGPLYASAAGAISKESNSSNRVSRAASPSLGQSAENNRF